jgi:hypothetical protein
MSRPQSLQEVADKAQGAPRRVFQTWLLCARSCRFR